MPTNKERITTNLDAEDYQWLDEKAELTGNSRAGVLRQIVRGLRLREPKLLDFGESELVFADEPGPTGNESAAGEEDAASEVEQDSDGSEENGLEAFRRE